MASRSENGRWLIIIQTIIALVILGLAGFYLSRHPEVFSRLRDLNSGLILFLLLANLAMHWSNGLVNLYACRPFGVELKFREWFGLAVLNNFASLFLPFAAAVGIRAVYLKKKHGFLYSHFISLMAGYHAVLFAAVGALLLISLVFIQVSSEIERIFLWLPAIFVAAGSIALLFPLPKLLRRGRLGLVAEGWEILRRNRPALTGIAFSVLGLEVFLALQLLWGFQAVGRHLPFWNMVFIAAWLTLIHVVKITPGNLGVLEGFIAGFATLSGVPLQEGLLVAGLVRVFNIISSLILAPVFAALLGINLTAPAANSGSAQDEVLQTDYSQQCPEVLEAAGRWAKAEKILRLLQANLPDLISCRVLDMGCSSGEITEYLSPYVKDILGIDVDETAIALAQKRSGRARYELRRADATGLPEGSFDLILINHVYEHVPSAPALFAEARRLLCPGGWCYFAAGNRFWPIEPHYRLPLLSWLPRPLGDYYLRLCRGKGHYYERLRSYWGIRGLLKEFEVTDLTLTVLKEPEKYALEMGPKMQAALKYGRSMIKLFYLFIPTYLFLIKKPK